MFQFKRFVVYDEQSTMKVGTDSVLLGCWVNVDNIQNILEIGCGCGVISLILAQRTHNTTLTAIDIDFPSVEECAKNFFLSPCPERLFAKHCSLQDFRKQSTAQYELIVSNPPFFNHSLKPSQSAKKLARHTDELSFEELLFSVSKLLASNGRFCCVLPISEEAGFRRLASSMQLYCRKCISVFTKENKSPKRCLMEFSKHNGNCDEGMIFIQDKNGQYTPEYLSLTKNFYLSKI